MNPQVEKILQDLYSIEPALKQKEAELIKVVASLLENKPNTKFDREFAMSLKRQLLARASFSETTNSKFQFMKKLNFAFGGLAAIALVLAGSVYYNRTGQSPLAVNSEERLLPWEVTVTKTQAENAFGSLNVNQLAGRGGAGGAGGGGMGGDMAYSEKSAIAPATPPSSDMVIEPSYSYKFVYKGEAITPSGNKVEVLRRVKAGAGGGSVLGMLTNLNLGLADLKSFAGSRLESFQLTQDQEYGYMVHVSLKEGMVNINENWEKWPVPGRDCRDEACFNQYKLQPSQIPQDSELLAIADQFLKDHGIPTTSYGQPYVNNQWRADYARAVDKSVAYVPDVATVIYPLVINGQNVMDESGYPVGLNVSVNVRVKKVSGLYEIYSPKFESSEYLAETNAARITEIAQKGGFRSYYYQDPNSKQVEVELGTPTVGLVKLWVPKSNSSDEVYVPAYIFPVTNVPGNVPFYQKSVVVPMVKEILDQSQEQPPFHILERPAM